MACRFAVTAALFALLSAGPATAPAATVYGLVYVGACNVFPCYGGSGESSLFASGTFEAGEPALGTHWSGGGSIDVNREDGQIKGKQYLYAGPNLSGVPVVNSTGKLQYLVKILAPSDHPKGTPVPLDLLVELDGSFQANDVNNDIDFVDHKFTAALSVQRQFSGATLTSTGYVYQWTATIAGDDFQHRHTNFANPICDACTSAVFVEDPVDQYRNGFDNIQIIQHLGAELIPGELFYITLDIASYSAAKGAGAAGNWDNTVSLGFLLPEGYDLTDSAGNVITGWDLRLTPVPVPGALPMFLAGAGVLAAWRRVRFRGG